MMIHLRHFLQEENKSCVPASVRMVLDALGIERSELEIGAALSSEKEGTSVLNIELLPQTGWGVTVWTGEMSPTKLKEYLDEGVPVIVAVWTDALPYWRIEHPHALVVVGYDEELIYLHDAKFPDAPKTVSWANFLSAWEAFGRFGAIIRKQQP